MPTNDEATPRPWRVCQYKHETYVGSNDGVSLWNSDGALYRIADGVQIVRAVNAMPAMIEEMQTTADWMGALATEATQKADEYEAAGKPPHMIGGLRDQAIAYRARQFHLRAALAAAKGDTK